LPSADDITVEVLDRATVAAWGVEAEVAGDALVRYVGLASLTGLVVTLLSIRYLPGWIGAAVGVGQGLGWCALMLWRYPSRWLGNIAVFGLAAGLAELPADAWLVRSTGTLSYPPDGPFLLASPLYMPAAWLGMLSLPMALSVLCRRRFSRGASTVVVASVVGLYIPTYEWLARLAGWWRYEDPHLLFGAVPTSIVVGEVLLALPLVAATERLARMSPARAALLGAGQGLWIFASYALARAVCASA
jgi:hypothetical protein